jgi:uncharacterized protein YjbJ (UPF0337 family)
MDPIPPSPLAHMDSSFINSPKLSYSDHIAAGLLAILANGGRFITQEVETIDADLPKGTWMQFKDKLKLQWDKFVKLDLQENERSYAKIIGMVQERYGRNCASLVRERYGEHKDELMRWADPWQQRAQPKATRDMTRRGEIIKKIWMTEYGHISLK